MGHQKIQNKFVINIKNYESKSKKENFLLNMFKDIDIKKMNKKKLKFFKNHILNG